MASIITSLFQATSLFDGAKSLFVGKGKSSIGTLVIDACLKEVITYSSQITEHPIETKTSISDHIFKDPLRVKIEGYITDSPIKLLGLFETPLQNNSVDKFMNNIKSFLPFNKAAKPSEQAYQLLRNIWQDRQVINIVTKLEAFNNMVIENIEFNNDTETGGRLEFVADLKQITYASVKTTINISSKAKGLKALTSPVSNNGNQSKAESPPLKSWGVKGLDAVGGFLKDAFSPANMERSVDLVPW